MGHGLRTLAFLLVSLAASSAFAGFVRFDAITSNGAVSAAIGEAQLFVEVTNPGGNQALFTFFNAGPLASTVSEVFFDDGTVLAGFVIDNSGDIVFQAAASPSITGRASAVPL